MKDSVITFFMIYLVASTISIYSQDNELGERIKKLEARLDSLENIISNSSVSYQAVNPVIESKIDSLVEEKDDLLQELTSFISFDETVQSSKKKRINDLLDALRSRDGVLNFNGDATSIIQHNAGDGSLSTATGSFDFFAFSQLGNYAKVFINLEGIGGDGPNSRLNSYSGLNGDAGSLQDASGTDRIHVLEAWVEFSFFDNWLQVTTGKIDVTNYFDVNLIANDETSQFISSPFVNNAAFAAPSNSPGVRVNVDLSSLLLFQLAVVSNNNSGDQIFSNLFKIGSTGLNIDFGRDIFGFVHLFGYNNSAYEKATGYGFSSNIMIKNKLALFCRWNENSDNLAEIHGIKKGWSSGAEFSTSLYDTELRSGIAFGEIVPTAKNIINEKLLEFYISYQVNEWIYLSPHFQIVWNAAGVKNQNYKIAAFRTQFNF